MFVCLTGVKLTSQLTLVVICLPVSERKRGGGRQKETEKEIVRAHLKIEEERKRVFGRKCEMKIGEKR